ncbi:MAG: 16S rRNA (uracil(1498)-N(3))-methyltransferase [Gammaproteobacteria bacterium]|jgi:16S rRNA (uracil1498-N3)-methyltransferase|nr:16S rRNA (uracil(1498)-N(3))-methyltransferase [Chromatiales bacterium]MDP6151007.1 16S rRNA (uracil(1498)-N(3))-methyltransferase [Gammaproteobacteria bacterium]MDP7153322.1 16S rRNA (uracil(1498)-N(3))-methyltransferase [Gammaproteobacteria bacterium]MDP7270437.1 16S rRNA (uracil(1498)-N(3))-methyltransferase [Gammaproteobacteria bacterium]MDP7419815.1 16S rRNA (uracil(1498)-N(3))-methyltransferase [Gammaproteobacteria bacterium]
MRNVRIYIDTELNQNSEAKLSGNAAHHIAQVLRKRVGDPLVLFNGQGDEYAANIIAVSKNNVQVQVGSCSTPPTDSGLNLSLWHGLCRGGRMDSVIQKATELGVRLIQPVLCERGVVKLDNKKGHKRVDHWRSIAISACEQSGRNLLPEIAQPLPLANCLKLLDPACTAVLLDPSGKENLESVVEAGKPTVVLTGPEGGFTVDEINASIDAGFTAVALGPRIMRTETAPIVALGLVQYFAGDLGAS